MNQLDLEPIRHRSGKYFSLGEDEVQTRLGKAWATAVGLAASFSANDVPDLIAEIERLRRADV